MDGWVQLRRATFAPAGHAAGLWSAAANTSPCGHADHSDRYRSGDIEAGDPAMPGDGGRWIIVPSLRFRSIALVNDRQAAKT